MLLQKLTVSLVSKEPMTVAENKLSNCETFYL